jgi:hypothetical protein
MNYLLFGLRRKSPLLKVATCSKPLPYDPLQSRPGSDAFEEGPAPVPKLCRNELLLCWFANCSGGRPAESAGALALNGRTN